jgi:predicted Fe-Mo cluster-binding NifX family protein
MGGMEMIIAIPVDKNTMNANISTHFGRTEFFLIWNSESEEHLFINNDAMNAQGGAGIKASQVLVDKNVDAIISPRLGKNAYQVIDGADIRIYASEGSSLKDNLDKLNSGKLSPLNDIHEGFHGTGGK